MVHATLGGRKRDILTSLCSTDMELLGNFKLNPVEPKAMAIMVS